jgi:Lar family restriction alleviation protein
VTTKGHQGTQAHKPSQNGTAHQGTQGKIMEIEKDIWEAMDSGKPIKLKPCPFCGGGDVVYTCTAGWGITCDHCGASGPVCDEEVDAIATWNTRSNINEQG